MSYIGLDMENLRILFKVPDIKVAGLLSGLEHPDVAQWTFPADWAGFWRRMSMHEMRIILRNSTGEEYKGTNIRELGDKVFAAFQAFPMSSANLFQLMQKAGPNELPCDAPLTDADLEGRTHISKPAAPPPARPVAPSIPSAPGIPSAPPAIAAPWAPPAAPAIPSAPPMATVPSIPKAPPPVPKAPPTKGATGRVWEIADRILSESEFKSMTQAEVLANKAFRKCVIEACEAEGLNPGTAATQFGKWKASKQE